MWDLPRDRVGRYPAPWVSTAWDNASSGEHAQLDDSLSRAWDELCGHEGWRAWHAAVEPQMRRPDAFSSISFEERDTTRTRKGKDGLFMYVPIDEWRTSEDRVAFMRGVWTRFFTKYAQAFGAEPPPAVGRR